MSRLWTCDHKLLSLRPRSRPQGVNALYEWRITAWHDHTKLSPDKVMTLLVFCLNAEVLGLPRDILTADIWHCSGFTGVHYRGEFSDGGCWRMSLWVIPNTPTVDSKFSHKPWCNDLGFSRTCYGHNAQNSMGRCRGPSLQPSPSSTVCCRGVAHLISTSTDEQRSQSSPPVYNGLINRLS